MAGPQTKLKKIKKKQMRNVDDMLRLRIVALLHQTSAVADTNINTQIDIPFGICCIMTII
jgi:hypothetical protein